MRSFLGTPYRHNGRSPGVAMDCAGSIREAFERAGIIPHEPLPQYPYDWALHCAVDDSRYQREVERYAHRVEREPLPADVALFKVGKCISHGALVVEWPIAIHAWNMPGEKLVGWVDLTQGRLASAHPQDGLPRFRGVWSVW